MFKNKKQKATAMYVVYAILGVVAIIAAVGYYKKSKPVGGSAAPATQEQADATRRAAGLNRLGQGQFVATA